VKFTFKQLLIALADETGINNWVLKNKMGGLKISATDPSHL
jgi:hypothetical protein